MTRLCRVVIWLLLAGSLQVSAQSQQQVSTSLLSTLAFADAPSATKTAGLPYEELRAAERWTQVNWFATNGGSPSQPSSPLLAGRDHAILLAAAVPDATGSASATAEQSTAPADAHRSPTRSWVYWQANAGLFASSVANAEFLMRCPNCTAVRTSLHRRSLLYGAGLPIDAGIAYLSYALKKREHRWWFVPAVAATAGNALLAYHWASRTP